MALRWFGHVRRLNGDDFAKRMCEGRIEEEDVRGRPLVGWINKVGGYWRESAGRKVSSVLRGSARRGGAGGISAVAISLGEFS